MAQPIAAEVLCERALMRQEWLAAPAPVACLLAKPQAVRLPFEIGDLV
jgi:hypothetical protein